ncbi:DUF3737 family protein [Petralouisia muris]|uniref:DUF3737 family protein n=1 Tax=Petralouisia muris TaxID=3032872 RepID=UPI00269189E2
MVIRIIENQTFDMERALYGSEGVLVKSCSFDGPADGESAFKECSDIVAENCFFNLRYPFWHNNGLKISGSEMKELCRASRQRKIPRLYAIAVGDNAQGGTLIIGRNDNGGVKGIHNAKKLLEDIPNKIVSMMNIIADVNLIEENGLESIEIIVDSYPSPVNYRGKYYYRSGSTMQEIKGIELLKFLYEKQGKTWDSVPIPGETVDSLSKEALQEFRKNLFIKSG